MGLAAGENGQAVDENSQIWHDALQPIDVLHVRGRIARGAALHTRGACVVKQVDCRDGGKQDDELDFVAGSNNISMRMSYFKCASDCMFYFYFVER